MAWFEEWEWQLDGRMKSVAIVALAALLLTTYGKMQGQKGIADGKEENPIDQYFEERAEVFEEGGMEPEEYFLIYLECWEMELAHAYECMGKDVPESFWENGGYGREAKSHFESFVREQGYLESYYQNGAGYFAEDGTKEMEQGSCDALQARIELIRLQTLRIYETIQEKQDGIPPSGTWFAFDSLEAEKMLKNSTD